MNLTIFGGKMHQNRFELVYFKELIKPIFGDFLIYESIENEEVFKQLQEILLIKTISLGYDALDQQNEKHPFTENNRFNIDLLLFILQTQLQLVEIAFLL